MVARDGPEPAAGPDVLRAFEEALRDIRREEDAITRRIARTTDRVGKLRETELGQVRQLVRQMRSPEAVGDIDTRLAEAEAHAREMIGAHAAAMEALERELATREDALSALSAQRFDALEAVAGHQRVLEGLREAVEQRLGSNTLFGEVERAEADLRDMAERVAEKAGAARAIRDERLGPYHGDALFSYLRSRGFGTPDYAARPPTRALDAMVARHIDFSRLQANYDMLSAWPGRLDAHARDLADQADAAARRRAEMEAAAIEAAGGGDAREALLALEAEIVRIDGEIVAAEDAREALTQQHKELAEGGDPTFEDALGVLERALDAPEIVLLLDEARQSQTEADTSLLARITDTRRRIEVEDAELGEQRARLGTLEARRRELEDIVFEFKRARFDDPGSRFSTRGVTEVMLSDFLKGAMPAIDYWRAIVAGQGWSEAALTRPARAAPRPPDSDAAFSRPR